MPIVGNASTVSQRGGSSLGEIVISSVLGLVILFAGVSLARRQFRNEIKKGMTPGEYAEMRRFLDTPLEFPAEWAVVEPYSEDLATSIREVTPVLEYWSASKGRIRSQFGEQGQALLEKLRNGQPLSASEEETAWARLEEARPLFDGLRTLAKHPGFDLEALEFLYGTEVGFPRGRRFLEIQARLDLSHDEYERPMANGLVLLRLLRRHPASRLIHHLLSFPASEAGNSIIASAVRLCERDSNLRPTLEELNALSNAIHLDALEDPFLTDLIGTLRYRMRKGNEFDFEPGRLGEYYITPYYRQYREDNNLYSSAFHDRIITPSLPSEMSYDAVRISDRGSLEMRLREKKALAISDLTRIDLASRIRKKESGETTTEVKTLVPSLLPDEPLDPFTGASYPFDASAEEFYSVGPDETDDGKTLLYSPTNGAVSTGDLFVR